MEDGSVLAALLYNWAPILLMIGFWLWIMRRVGGPRQRNYIERSIAFMDRQEQLLEQIATALEQRNKTRSYSDRLSSVEARARAQSSLFVVSSGRSLTLLARRL